MNKPSRFKLWNKVDWCGMIGQVVKVETYGAKYPIIVNFPDLNEEASFTSDGRYWVQQTKPSLKKIYERKKK